MAILAQQAEGTAAYRRMYFHCVDATDGITAEVGEAGGQPQISVNGGAWGNSTNVLVAIGNGRYYLEPTAIELGTLGTLEGRYKSANTAESIGTTLQIVPFDPYDGVRAGLTALPNANADAAGGLPVSDAGGLDLDTKLANTNEITAARMGALTDWINGGRLDLILDIIAADTTTDIPGTLATIAGYLDTEIQAIIDAVAALENLSAAEAEAACDASLVSINLDHLMKVAVADRDVMAEVVDDTVLANLMTKTDGDTSDFDHATDSLEAIKDAAAGDLTSIMGTALSESTAGNLAANLSTFYDNADALTAKVVDDVGAPASGGGSSLVLGAGDTGDWKEEAEVHFHWNTIDRSGASVAPSTAGTLRVYKDDGTGEVTAPTGITDTRAFDGVVGLHECKIDTSANSFYEKEKNYSVVLVGAVIDTKTVNAKVGSFSIENRWANVHFHYGGK